MGQKRSDAGTRRNGETEIRGQRSEVRDQRKEMAGVRFSHIEILLWERLPRPACPGRSPGELVEGQPRFWRFNDLTEHISDEE
ncbi:MAG: hypothetical protein JRD00_04215 [Deltaproteobacteria bacterium]|nr:hypothetical protein [Deltaproteobacteria bacterium]